MTADEGEQGRGVRVRGRSEWSTLEGEGEHGDEQVEEEDDRANQGCAAGSCRMCGGARQAAAAAAQHDRSASRRRRGRERRCVHRQASRRPANNCLIVPVKEPLLVEGEGDICLT